jgi:hypothetical protein
MFAPRLELGPALLAVPDILHHAMLCAARAGAPRLGQLPGNRVLR